MSDEPDPPEDFDDDEPRPRSRLEGLIPDILKKALAQGAGALSDEKLRETLVAEVVRKAIHVGNEVVDSTEEQVRKLLNDVPVPKEVGDRVSHKLDEFKGEMFRIVKQEVHEFLEKVDLGAEMQKLLTSLSFEIVTEIRFIPNEKGGQPGVKPDVKAGVRLKKADEPRAGRRSRRPAPPTDET
jgi:hypothetical protein